MEAGQLLVLLPAFPAVSWLRREPGRWRRARIGLGTGFAVVALVWLIQRVLAALG